MIIKLVKITEKGYYLLILLKILLLRAGLFLIKRKVSNLVYKLELLKYWQNYLGILVAYLKKWKEPDYKLLEE